VSPGRRLLVFALSLGALGAALEWTVRAHEPAFAAATNRALAKAALLDRHGPVDVLFLGTSRMQDGVSPRLFSDELARNAPGTRVEAFNLAFTSSSLDSLEALAARFGHRAGLRLAVVELSAPQVENGPPVWERDPPPGQDIEGRLTAWLRAHVRTLAERKALVWDNLVRLPSLLWFGADLDGSETRVLDQALAFFGRRESPPPAFDASGWVPRRISSRSPSGGAGQGEAPSPIASRLAAIARVFDGRVVFVSPPYTRAFEDPKERSPEMKALFAQVALESGAPVWDYTDLELPKRWFRGKSHLNREGRAVFSTMLAREVGRAGLLRATPTATR
jgi:hypothetical protein